MDTDISNGSSDSAASGTALLSRKGLFGKSGVLNQNLDSSIAIHQDAQKGEHGKSDRNNEEQNTSTLMFDTHEHLSDGNTSREEEPVAGDEHSTVVETTGHTERVEVVPSPKPPSESAHVANSKDDEEYHAPTYNEEENKCDKEQEEKEASDEANEEISDDDPNASKDNDSEEGANEDISDDGRNPSKDNGDEQEVNEESSSGDHNPNQSSDEKEGIAEESPPTPEPHHEEVAEPMVQEEDQSANVAATETDEDGTTTDNVMEALEEASNEAAVETDAQEEDSTVENPDVEMSEQLEGNVDESAQPASESEGAITEETQESEKINDESSSEKATSKEDAPKEDSKQDDGEEKEDEENEAKTPKRRSSSRRTVAAVATEPRVSTRAKATPATAPRTSSRKRHEEEEKADDEEKPAASSKTRKSNVDAKKKVENVEESKTPRQRGRRVNVEESKGTPAATPSKGRRSTRKDAAEAEDENVDEKEHKESKRDDGDDSSPKRSSPRRRSSTAQAKVEVTPKASTTRRGRSKNESTSSATDKEGKKESNADVETPRRLRKSATTTTATPQTPKKSAKTPKSAKKEDGESHDPYDIDTEMEKHPEPLKNIQMEVQSFGEVKYAKVGSGKYERTEKTAEQRVGNLAELTPRTKQRRSLADLTPGRKKAASTAGSSTAPQPSRGSRKSSKKDTEVDDEENKDEPMEVDDSAHEKSTPKRKANTTTPKPASSSRKRRAPSETPVVPSKRQQIEVPHLDPAELLAVDYPQDEHAQYEAGARVFAMFDGLFYPAIVVSRDGLGRYKVHFIEDDLVKDVPPAGVIPLRALDRDKECFYSESVEKDRLAVKVVKSPDHTSASAWFEAEFELEQLDDDGEPTGKKLKGTWTKLALSKDDWREYINRKSREATDVIADNIESTEDRQLRRSKAATPLQKATPKPPPKSSAKKPDSPSTQPKTPARGGRQKKGSAAKSAKAEAEEEEPEEVAETHTEQIFAGMLFILTSANRPNNDTGFKKKFMTDFISSHGGLVVDDMKEVDEHPEMERFLVSDTHYRTHKYLAALVRAMPCVSHEWISKCLDEKKLVDYKPFLLPSGVSILDDQEYPLPTKRGLLLRNKRVMVHSNVTPPSKKSMSFEQIWVPMVPQLGGEIVTEMPDEEGKLDILLTDHSATPSLVEKARKIGCIVVSSEWLIQGIIMDRLPDVNAHQKFLHNGGVCT